MTTRNSFCVLLHRTLTAQLRRAEHVSKPIAKELLVVDILYTLFIHIHCLQHTMWRKFLRTTSQKFIQFRAQGLNMLIVRKASMDLMGFVPCEYHVIAPGIPIISQHGIYYDDYCSDTVLTATDEPITFNGISWHMCRRHRAQVLQSYKEVEVFLIPEVCDIVVQYITGVVDEGKRREFLVFEQAVRALPPCSHHR